MKKLKYLIFVLLLFPVSVFAGSKYVYIDDDVSINEEVGNSAVAFGGTVNEVGCTLCFQKSEMI